MPYDSTKHASQGLECDGSVIFEKLNSGSCGPVKFSTMQHDNLPTTYNSNRIVEQLRKVLNCEKLEIKNVAQVAPSSQAY